MFFPGHVGAALIVAYLLKINPLLTALGGLLPDFDLLTLLIGWDWSQGHRKFTHSLMFPGVLLVIAFIFPITTPIFIGSLVHFAMDQDQWGIPLLYPFKKKYYSLRRVRHSKPYSTPKGFIKHWFKHRDALFYIEWTLFIIGLYLTWGYWVNLTNSLVILFS